MTEEASTTGGRRPWLALLPLALFAALAAIFIIGLEQEDPSRIPSVLLDKPAPDFDLPPLAGLERQGVPVPGLKTADLKGQVSLVNIWASWCGPCREEHPQLMSLSSFEGIRLVGINYKDEPENARRFLGALGLPFVAVGVDGTGRAALDWGVYGVPETFLVDRQGIIRYKHIGPITPKALEEALLPKIRAALAQ